ncbi:MAG: hypothetical protein ACP5E3_03910 [Bacteroidales bacterium]
MKKLLFFILSILLIIISCEKEDEGFPIPNDFTVSEGFAVGCIHIEFNKDPDVSSVILERREKGSENWQVITATGLSSFEDNHGYPNTGMPPGKIFEYRIKNDWPQNAEYSQVEEGYAYEIIPVTEIEITSNLQWDDKTLNILTWNEANNGSFINESEIFFDIYRSEDSLGNYQKVGQVGEDRSFSEELPADMKGTKVYYRIDVYFSFELNLPSGGNHWESTTPVEGTVVGSPVNSGGNPILDYTMTDLGQVASSVQGGIPQILEKNVNGSVFLGLINEAGATGYGVPSLYRLNGSSWTNEWTADPPNEFNEIHFGIASGSQFVAGIDDSLCVYEWNGSAWSDNLTPSNLGKADSPSGISIEIIDEELYLAIKQYPNYELQVLRYNQGDWQPIGDNENGILASGNILDLKLENIDGTLYISFLEENTLHIMHFNGTSWENDLSWTKDYIADIDIAMGSSGLYFISGSSNPVYRGGAYKVTSSTTAEEIISNLSDEWFQFPLSLAIDSEDNLILSSMNFESAESFYPFINIWDGVEWKTLSGDFSDGIDPVSIVAQGTDIIYIFGEAASENGVGDPTRLMSRKFTK